MDVSETRWNFTVYAKNNAVHCLEQGLPDKLKQQSRNLHLVIRDTKVFAGKILAKVVAGRDFSGPRAP